MDALEGLEIRAADAGELAMIAGANRRFGRTQNAPTDRWAPSNVAICPRARDPGGLERTAWLSRSVRTRTVATPHARARLTLPPYPVMFSSAIHKLQSAQLVEPVKLTRAGPPLFWADRDEILPEWRSRPAQS